MFGTIGQFQTTVCSIRSCDQEDHLHMTGDVSAFINAPGNDSYTAFVRISAAKYLKSSRRQCLCWRLGLGFPHKATGNEVSKNQTFVFFWGFFSAVFF